MAPKDTFFCSVDMSLIQLYIANENGREVVMALGELSQVQFRDVSWKSDTNYDGSCVARRLMMNLK
jgi:V-type H+-transporting ATPase subunit a